MGMSTYIIGLRSSNEPEYLKHKMVLDACLVASIQKLPEETATYFGSLYPQDIDPESPLQVKIPKKEYREDMSEGIEINVSDIPTGVSIIRFVNSW